MIIHSLYIPNKKSQRHILCSVMSHVVLFAYPIVEYLGKEHSYKNPTKEVALIYVILAIQSRKYLTKFRVIAILSK